MMNTARVTSLKRAPDAEWKKGCGWVTRGKVMSEEAGRTAVKVVLRISVAPVSNKRA